MMPKVLVLHTGGTLMMRPEAGPGAPLTPDVYGRDLAAELPSLVRIADLETRILFTMDSGDMQPADWVAIAREVHAAAEDDSSTGSSSSTEPTRWRTRRARSGSSSDRCPSPSSSRAPSVRSRWRGPTRARTSSTPCSSRPFPFPRSRSPSLPALCAGSARRSAMPGRSMPSTRRIVAPLVELGLGVDVAEHVRKCAPLEPFDARLEPRVLAVRVFPGIDPSLVRGAVRAGVRGLVLEAYGTGNLPHLGGSLIPALEEARERGVPVLVVSQCLRGFVDMSAYAGRRRGEGRRGHLGRGHDRRGSDREAHDRPRSASAIRRRCVRGSKPTSAASERRRFA